MIEIRVGGHVLLRTWQTDIQQITALHVATIRRFRQGLGFPVTFLGYQDDVDRKPAGQVTVWLHPSMPVIFDYGADYEPVRINQELIVDALKQMDDSELGVVITKAQVPIAFY